MTASAQRLDWIRLAHTNGIGPVSFFQLSHRDKTATAGLAALPDLAGRARRAHRPQQ